MFFQNIIRPIAHASCFIFKIFKDSFCFINIKIASLLVKIFPTVAVMKV